MRTPRRFTRTLAAASLAAAGLTGIGVATGSSSAEAAQACESWSATLRPGASGANVRELQIRVAGWVPSGQVMGVDGVYGSQTSAAVKRFQAAYGLGADGVAGSQTFAKLRSLTKSDCTPLHFSWSELENTTNCGRGFSGITSTQKSNLRRGMWQAEALRRQLGDLPLTVTSSWRDKACDGYPYGEHYTGRALDLQGPAGVSESQLCSIFNKAKVSGYGGIYGPGYPNHHNHIHVDYRGTISWSASRC